MITTDQKFGWEGAAIGCESEYLPWSINEDFRLKSELARFESCVFFPWLTSSNFNILIFVMNKKIAFVAMLSLSLFVSAQNIVDFESYPLGAESFDNGVNASGYFMFNDVYLSNNYDTTWSSWTGFSISNMTDTTTAGWGNQYSSFPGHGSNNSNQYGVLYDSGVLYFSPSESRVFDSIKITNTTYAAISMRDGDAYGKKFGSPTNASGAIDGTNGEDFFKVWIICEGLAGNNDKDSVEFYLADYRFVDSTLDYIVDKWTNIDLTGLGFHVNKISFRFESSDMSAGYINTPTYFAIDDVNYQYLIGIKDMNQEASRVYPNPANDILRVEGGEGRLELYSPKGILLMSQSYSETSVLDVLDLDRGIYILKIFNDNRSSTKRVVLN